MSPQDPVDADGLVIPPGPSRGAWLDDAPPTEHPDTTDHEDDDGPKPTQASMLVELATADYWFGTSELGEAFAVPHDGPMVARILRGSGSLRAELASGFLAAHGKVPSSSALADAMMVLEGAALTGPRCKLALRVGRNPDNDALVLDLGDEDGRVVEITRDGWTILEVSPILFRRTALSGPLPAPRSDIGDIDRLRPLINISDDDWPLLVACLVACLVPEIPHPILGFLGKQGSAKTTTAKHVSAVVDPSAAQTRAAPRDVESWVVAASGSWIVVLDNVSRVPQWLSDALCRAATGDALVRRKLYTDGDLAVIAFRRVVAITSIDPGALAGDLAERLVAFDLAPITETSRQQDATVTDGFAQAHPAILAGLLDIAVQVLAHLDDIVLDRMPRMADFARIVAATDRVLATDALDRYLGGRTRIAEDVVDGDRVASMLRDLGDEGWEGSATDLLETLTERLPHPDRPPRDWPTSAKAMSGALIRCEDALGLIGINVAPAGQDPTTRRKKYRIQRFESFDASEPGLDGQDRANQPEGLSEGLTLDTDNPSDNPSPRNGHEPAAITPSEASKGPKGSTRPISADRGYRCEGCAVPIDRPYWCDECGRHPIEREGAA